jgi:protein-S-isoprenylcysteine O-methyltransferase Ste14
VSDAPHEPSTPARGAGALAGISLLAVVWFSLNFFLVFPAGILWAFDVGFLPPTGATRALGGGLIALGLTVWLGPLRRFIFEGRGTPAPVVPPDTLVVTGLYTRIRNPMYLSYVGIALGEAILYRSLALAVYALLLFGIAHAYVVGSEEKILRQRFGAQYAEYCAQVGRWLPRRRRR